MALVYAAVGTRLLQYVAQHSSYRRETVLQGGLVMAKSERVKLGDNIHGHYRFIFNHCDVIGQQSNRNLWKTKNKGYYAVQGHSRSSTSVSIESPYATWH